VHITDPTNRDCELPSISTIQNGEIRFVLIQIYVLLKINFIYWVFEFSKYTFDKDLKISKNESLWNASHQIHRRSVSTFPSFRVLMRAASDAYGKHSSSSDAKNPHGINWLLETLYFMNESENKQALNPKAASGTE